MAEKLAHTAPDVQFGAVSAELQHRNSALCAPRTSLSGTARDHATSVTPRTFLPSKTGRSVTLVDAQSYAASSQECSA